MQYFSVCIKLFLLIIALTIFNSLGLSAAVSETASKPVSQQSDAFQFSVGPNLFVDDYLIAKNIGLKRTTHQPKKMLQPVLRKEETWHQQPQWFFEIKRDPKTDSFRAWYVIKNPDHNPDACFGYAESIDGITWNRPNLGLVSVDGSKKNNIIAATQGCFGLFLVDEGPDCADPSRRYKMAHFGSGLAVAFSADGLSFTEYPGNPILPMDEGITRPVMIGGVISDIIDGCWDPIKGEYLIGCKVMRNGYPGKPHYNAEGYRRLVGSTTSRDFLNWPKPRVIITPDLANGIEEFYGMKPTVRGNLYLGFLRVLRDDLPANAGGEVMGVGWTELTTSRDGRNWTRYQDKFIDRNPISGTWDHAFSWYADCITVGDKDYVYYGGYSHGHKTGDRQVGLAILRKNGFVSRDAGSKSCTLKTPVGKLPGNSMTVNAVVRGELTARIVDATGNAIIGFDWTDCKPVRGDSVSHLMKWRGSKFLPRFQPVSLEFSLRDAELYGFDIAR